ncbi:MAG: ribonuclease P protein component [Alphaproteobacteria bacterium]|nr:ribonuclease P protein component [Alphaproteobacteria bacterium]
MAIENQSKNPEAAETVRSINSCSGSLTKMVKRADFLRMNSTSYKHHAAGFVLLARPRLSEPLLPAGTVRIGYTASRKVGGAVQRNRAKRRLRALVAEVLPTLAHPDWDFVLIAREVTVKRGWNDLKGDLEIGLSKINRSHGAQNRTNLVKPLKES